MKCEKCGKNEATTHYKKIINGKTTEYHLCPACAQQMYVNDGLEGPWSQPFHSLFGGGFDSFWNDMLGTSSTAAALGTARRCPTCGMTERELQRSGRVGCPTCYETFRDLLMPYIQKLHGATQHIGPTPALAQPAESSAPQEDPIAKLRIQLQQAIAEEQYEQAAHLRDEIRRLESEQK